MEATGFKRKLEHSKNHFEKVKIIFQYPASNRAIVKSGVVTSVDEDSFTLEESYDGESVFSYQYIVEIVGVRG